MEVIPAVDVKGGRVVRLVKGDPRSEIKYELSPSEAVEKWACEGARWVHLVDLDAALGLGSNSEVIVKAVKVAKEFSVGVQVAGGVRSLEKARFYLDQGVDRVVIGTLALKSPNKVERLAREYSWGRVVVAADHEKGRLLVEGWRYKAGVDVFSFVKSYLDIGCHFFLVTSRVRDGMLSGPDLKVTSRILRLGKVNLIVAGGVSSIEHVRLLAGMGVYGVIIGRALYDGVLRLREALKAAGG